MFRRFAPILVTFALLAMPSGARADDELDAARGELGVLEMSDRALDAELAQLAADVAAARGDVARLDEQVAVIQASAAVLEQQVRTARAEVATRRELVRRRAVESFMVPSGTEMGALLSADGVDELSQRFAYLDQVSDNDTLLLDQLAAAEADLVQAQADHAAANQAVAEARERSAARLAELEVAQARQTEVRRALDERIAGVQAEVEALEAEEAAVAAILAEAAARAAATTTTTTPTTTARPGVSSTTQRPTVASTSTTVPREGTSEWSLRWPVDGTVSSEFGSRWGRNHNGIDIAAPTGTPIYAAEDGQVIHSGERGGYGLATFIDHGDGLVTVYGHQSRLVADMGDTVERGDLIGYVGSTGQSTGPHLHFETRIDGVPEDPRIHLS